MEFMLKVTPMILYAPLLGFQLAPRSLDYWSDAFLIDSEQIISYSTYFVLTHAYTDIPNVV